MSASLQANISNLIFAYARSQAPNPWRLHPIRFCLKQPNDISLTTLRCKKSHSSATLSPHVTRFLLPSNIFLSHFHYKCTWTFSWLCTSDPPTLVSIGIISRDYLKRRILGPILREARKSGRGHRNMLFFPSKHSRWFCCDFKKHSSM